MISGITGVKVSPGEAKKRYLTEDRTNYEASACTWVLSGAGSDTSSTIGVPQDLTLQVSRADDFEDATVVCPPLMTESIPVPDLGEEAYWSWTNPGTDATIGRIRTCTSTALITVQIDGISDESVARRLGTTIAAAALEAI